MRRKLAALLLALLLCVPCAAAETVPPDGLYSIGVSSSAKMFRIVDCVLRVEDGRMTAVLTMSGSGYGYLYQGTSAEAGAAPAETWTPHSVDAEGRHRFAVEIPYLDAELPMAAWSIRYKKWYDRTLVFFSDTLSPHREIAPEGVYSGVLEAERDLSGKSCTLRSDGESMHLEIDGGVYELPSLDVRVRPEGLPGWVKLMADALEVQRVTAPDGLYAAQVETDSSLLRFADCLLTVQDGKMIALLTAKNNNFAFIYPGLAKDALQDEAEWIAAVEDADGRYTYLLELSSLDNEIPVATYSAKKKLWYDRSLRIDSSALVSLNENS